VIGSAVFILPSQVAAQLGNWGPIAFLGIGCSSLLVALCFAEVGSRFEGTGGPYLYTRAAFGRFVAFEVGWMHWFTRVTAQASIVNAIALALGFYWPVMTSGIGRASMIVAVILAVGWINLRGVRKSAFVINLLTIAKLVPLALFIVVGLSFIDANRLTPLGRSVSDPILNRGALADLRLRWLRRDRRTGRGGDEPAPARAVRLRCDDHCGHGHHDAGANRGDRDAP
jgi:amino acid transporter